MSGDGKNLIWAFGMKRNDKDLAVSKDPEQHADWDRLNIMLNLPDFKSECRTEMFQMINQAFGSPAEILGDPSKVKL